MEKLNQILSKFKIAHYGAWTPEDIEECKNLLEELTHEDLFTLRMSKWFKANAKENPLYERVVELLHKDHFTKVFEELETMSTTELLTRYKELKAPNCKQKIQEIFLARYDEMSDDEQKKVKPILVKCGLMEEDKAENDKSSKE